MTVESSPIDGPGLERTAVRDALRRQRADARAAARGDIAPDVWQETFELIAMLLAVHQLHYPCTETTSEGRRVACVSCEEIHPDRIGTRSATWPCPTFRAIERGAVG